MLVSFLQSVLPIVPGSFLFPGLPEWGLPQGLAYKVISTDRDVLLENFGIDKPFTFIVRRQTATHGWWA